MANRSPVHLEAPSGCKSGSGFLRERGVPVAANVSSVRALAAKTDGATLTIAAVRLTNVTRIAAGARPLHFNARLARAAQGHARDMAGGGPFSHTSADGRSWEQRIRDAGHQDPAGENIAHGQGSAAAVVRAWMASPVHRRNILDRRFRTIGIGYVADGNIWVQDFGY